MAGTGVDSQSLASALRAFLQVSDADAGVLYLLEQDHLQAEAAYSPAGSFQFAESVPLGHGLVGHAAQTLHEARVSVSRGDRLADGELDHRIQAAAAIPLVAATRPGGGAVAKPRLLGVVILGSFRSPAALAPATLDPARALASVLSLAVGYQRQDFFQQKTLVGVMEKLSSALEERDPYTAGHSARAAALSLLIGERMGLDRPALEELRLGMALHDIGKVAIPDNVLHKTDKLTTEEFELMKTHTMVGFNICRPLQLSTPVLMIIRSHHEKLDGSGYPDKLKGDELPLPVRIAGVAIAFDAMKSKRPWREALTAEATLGELNKVAGRQFDAHVVQTLKELVDHPSYARIYPDEQKRFREAA
jgi:putative nucleotidyltransferase with HDIG domain